MKKFLVLSIMLAFGLACLIPGDAFALDKNLHKYNMLQSKSNQDFYVEIAPYFWLAGPDGDLRTEANSNRIPFDVQFDDLIDNVKYTLGFNGSFKKGKWGYYGDVFYMRLDDIDENDSTLPGMNLKIDEWIFTNAATFYLCKEDRSWLELMVGIRTWALDSDEIWNDPFVGLRFQWEFSPRWYSEFMANYGGLDIDGSEDAFEGSANVGYRISKKSALKFGYKIVSVDYDDGGYQFRNEQDGAFLGYYFFF